MCVFTYVTRFFFLSLSISIPQARRKGKEFKGAGPRAAGLQGRSFFNVLTDAIAYVKDIKTEMQVCRFFFLQLLLKSVPLFLEYFVLKFTMMWS